MSVGFILGRSGTGKTSYCTKAIVDALAGSSDGSPLIFLVPEQASYQAERAILGEKKIDGYSRLHVLSFDRLGFLLAGRKTVKPTVSTIGRQMIIHRILRSKKENLNVLGSSAESAGLARQMADTIAQLHRYAKTPEDIEQLLVELDKEKINALSRLKFADVALVFKEYMDFIEDRFVDGDAQLSRACSAISSAEFIKGGRLWVDGFSSFTTAELQILAELLKATENCQIALCMDASNIDLANPDPENINPASLFYPTERTYAQLLEIIKKCRLKLTGPIILKEAHRFSARPQLAHIEQNIFKLQAPRIEANESVRIVSAPNERAEVRFAARQILEMVGQKGYRYRDIAVIASDIETYQHYIRAYFEDYKIPYFIDKRKPLNQHPAAELVCSALKVATMSFSGGDIFAYLKTDLVPVKRSDIDLLENYCLAFGIRADDWLREDNWQYTAEDDADFDEQRVNKIRLEVSSPLLELRERLLDGDDKPKAVTAADFTRIIFSFLEGLGIRQRLSEWIEQSQKNADYTTADVHRQFYEKFVSVFDELVDVFGEEAMSCEDYLTIIRSAFSQLTLAFIPPTLDQVLVGSIDRSRHPQLRAVFLTGATQKLFPAPLFYGGILSDDDRRAAEAADFKLAPTTSQTLSERQYLAYIAFTRPCERLYVTYPAGDEKGNAAAPSHFIDDLEELFVNLERETVAAGQVSLDKIYSDNELAELLCSRLGKDRDITASGDSEQFNNLLGGICSDGQFSRLGSLVKSAVNYDNKARLDKDLNEKFFGGEIRCSATRLGTFASCPYKYFANYILELKERRELKFEPLDVGQFYHRVLDGWLKQILLSKKGFKQIEDEQLLQILGGQILELVKTDSFISNFARHSFHNEYIISSLTENLEDFVSAVAKLIRAGDFRPAFSEIGFGQRQEKLGEYKIRLSNKTVLYLNGKIDRLDIIEAEGEKLAAVFDYKRKGKSFSWTKLYHGLDMQLPLYILAVKNGSNRKNTVPKTVGGFYIPVEVSPSREPLYNLSQESGGFEHKAYGIFNGEFFRSLDSEISSGWDKFYNFRVTKEKVQYGDYGKSGALRPDDFENVLRYTEQKAVVLAEEILQGKIDIHPYKLSTESACQYCKYKSLCRFDWQINDYNRLDSPGKTGVLEKIKGKNV